MFGSTPYKGDYRPDDNSTSYKMTRDLAESQRQYAQLLEENAQLKEQARSRKAQHVGR